MNTPKYEIRIGKIDLTYSGWILQRQFNILLANNNSNTAFMVSIKSMYSIKILKGMFLCKPHTNILSKRAVFYYRLEIYFQALSFYFSHIYPYHEAWTMHRFCAYFSTHSTAANGRHVYFQCIEKPINIWNQICVKNSNQTISARNS